MLGYDVEKLNKELDREENSLSKKLAISGPIRMYGSVVTDKKALLSALVLLLDSFFENPVSFLSFCPCPRFVLLPTYPSRKYGKM